MTASPKVSESRLWSWLEKPCRKHFKKALHMTRLENSVGTGTPDVEGQLDGCGQFWMELKCCARPARETSKLNIKFRPTQLPWLRRRARAGGKVYVLVQVGSGATASRYLVSSHVLYMFEHPRTEKDLGSMSLIKPNLKAIEILEAIETY